MREWLCGIRKKQGKSQYVVAREIGVSQSYYAAIELGTRGNPLNVDVAKKIAANLGFDWQRFYEDDEGG
ncbi:MAG: helix-turn-helix transcriptional regulator [Ruminococcaceae bacterium]|nr:helix-turn-helix transcriptional regulator [Oscillospiraceae bacterium]